MIDSHCHFDFPVFDHDRIQQWQSARASGVTQLLMPGVEYSQWSRLEKLNQSNPEWHYGLGFHPLFLERYQTHHMIELEKRLQAKPRGCVAVGEIGLDAVIDVDFELQLSVFEQQLALAAKYDLPVIIHHRKTHHHIIRLLKQYKLKRKGCIHAFSGSHQDAENYVSLGYLLGVGGTITYPRGEKTRRSLCNVPLDYLMLETDAPTMPIYGFQGQRNQPDRLPHVVKALAQLMSYSDAKVVAQTSENFKRLFIRSN